MAGNYYLIEHKNDHIHIVAYFDKYYQLNELYIPSKIWGFDYSSQIVNLKSIQEEGVNHKGKDFVDTNVNTIIEYDLINIPQDQYLELFPDNYYHYIEKNKFSLYGMGAFVRPYDVNINAEVTIKVDSNVSIISNIENHFFDANFVKLNFKSLPDIIILGGAKVITYDKMGLNLVALNVDNNFSTQIVESIKNSSRKFNIFWEKYGFSLKNKLIMLIGPPIQINRNAYTAHVKHDTILAFIVPGKNEDVDLANLFDHEFHHFIFGCNALYGPIWFTEGFSDYYKDKISALDTGDKESFINKYNNTLDSYYKSSYCRLTDEEIDKSFFENKTIQKLPYSKGYLIAGQIDSLTSLDTVIKSLMSSCKNQGECEFNINTLIKNAGGLSPLDETKLRKLIQEFEKLNIDDFDAFKPHMD